MARYPMKKLKGLINKVCGLRVDPRIIRDYYTLDHRVNVTPKGVCYDLRWVSVDQAKAEELEMWLEENATEHNVKVETYVSGSFWLPADKAMLDSIRVIKEEKRKEAQTKREQAKKEAEKKKQEALQTAASVEEMELATALTVLKKNGINVKIVQEQ